jgi:hypothetical protein
VLRQHRSTQRKVPQGRADEERLVADMIELARQYGRHAVLEEVSQRARSVISYAVGITRFVCSHVTVLPGAG